MTYPITLIIMSFFFLVLSIFTYYQKDRMIEKLEGIMVFLTYGFVVIGVFMMIVGLWFATEYNNSPPCENLLNHTILHYTNGTGHGHGLQFDEETYYHYIDSCEDRPVYKAGSYLLTIMVWSGFLIGILIVLTLIIIAGRWFNQW